MATDDSIRERHGCACVRVFGSELRRSGVMIREDDHYLYVDGCSDDRALTQWQARYLAAKLYRLARRVRQRADDAGESV